MRAMAFVGSTELTVDFGVEFTDLLLECAVEGLGGTDLATFGCPVVENRRSRLVVEYLRSEELMMTTLLRLSHSDSMFN